MKSLHVLPLAGIALAALLLAQATLFAQDAAFATIKLTVAGADLAMAANGASNLRIHLNIGHTPSGKNFSPDFPVLKMQTKPISGAVPGLIQPAFFPSDVSKVVPTGKTIVNTAHHSIFVNCATASSCWGTPNNFLNNLNKSNFLHLADQYTGSTTAGRYTIGTAFNATVTIFPGLSGVPTLGENDILALIHSAASQSGVGYAHLYHIFLPKGVDHCMDGGPCYSPDNPSAFAFCAYHAKTTFLDIGTVYYTVEPFQNVAGCAIPAIPAPPNSVLIDSTASTLSHEVFEAITDPDLNTGFRALNSAPVFGQEIADLCQGPLAVFPINGKNYEVQLEYSNTFHACASTP